MDSKYNRGKDLSIYEKFSVYIATVIKRNINRIPPVDEIFLRGFKEKILDLEPEEQEGVEELKGLYQDKLEKLMEWSHKLSHAIAHIRQRSATHEHSIRIFEHVLGAILKEISKEEENRNKIVELDNNDQEIMNDKNYRLVSRLNDFLFNEENEYWKRNNGEEYRGEYNIFIGNGLFSNEELEYSHTVLYGRLKKIIMEEEGKAEKEIKDILNSYRNPYDGYVDSVFESGIVLIQLVLGRDLKFQKGIGWDEESLAIKEVNIMRPIGIMVLMHYIGDYIREDKRLNKKSIIDISDESDEFYINTGLDGTYRPSAMKENIFYAKEIVTNATTTTVTVAANGFATAANILYNASGYFSSSIGYFKGNCFRDSVNNNGSNLVKDNPIDEYNNKVKTPIPLTSVGEGCNLGNNSARELIRKQQQRDFQTIDNNPIDYSTQY